FMLNKPSIFIGRSKRLDNDLILDKDGMVSKKHAQITLGADGFTIRDLNSTNGVWVNGERIESRLLRDGDKIRLGATEMIFKSSATEPQVPLTSKSCPGRPRLILKTSTGSEEEFLLASEVIVGKSLTSDVRLSSANVDSRHAKVFSPDGTTFYIEDLGSCSGIKVNGEIVPVHSPVRLIPGDKITIGEEEIRFERD
ncbi:MAG: FHA domain-containing protein, partial [Armatimonadota bacterium]|nr:FHA domain-containing protein [Armatimonadota bacterium]